MNCNTLFHRFWKNLNVDAFVPLTILIIFLVSVLYFYSFNTSYKKIYEFGEVISYTVTEKPIPCPSGNQGRCTTNHTSEYTVIKYKIKRGNYIITHTNTIPKQCSDVDLKVLSDKPKTIKKYKIYNDYVGLFFVGNNSSKVDKKSLYILE